MDKKEPLISIIMPCYNAQEYVKEAIMSVAECSYSRNCELIIVNDGSTDKTEEIILQIKDSSSKKLIRV